MRICLRNACPNEFEPVRPKQVFCCAKCRLYHKRELDKKKHPIRPAREIPEEDREEYNAIVKGWAADPNYPTKITGLKESFHAKEKVEEEKPTDSIEPTSEVEELKKELESLGTGTLASKRRRFLELKIKTLELK